MEIYLDNSATTRVSDEAAALAARVMLNDYGNPSSLHRKGFEAEQLITAAREHLAGVLDVPRTDIIFGSCGSECNNLALLGAARANRRRGHRIVTTAVEHASLLGAAGALEADGFEVIRVSPRPDGSVDPQAVAEAVDEQTLLVSVMHVNSETGAINDIAAIAAAARRRRPDLLLHSDCVQSFGRLPVLPRRWGLDMVTVSGHKIHAPKGAAALYRKHGLRLSPLYYGSAQEGGLHSGTENVPAIAAFGLAAREMWRQHEQNEHLLRELHERLLKKISEHPNELCINSPPNGALHIVNLSTPGIRSEVMIHFLEQSGIYVSSGSACSRGAKSHVLTAMGLPPARLDSAIRISMSAYNTPDEIDAVTAGLLEGCRTLARKERK